MRVFKWPTRKGGETEAGGSPRKKAKKLADLQTLPEDSVSSLRSAFDGAFYLKQYEDVARSGVDPFEHYMSVGWKEMRDPSAAFSTSYYLRRFPDIATAEINPFLHWVLRGIYEGRHIAASEKASGSPLEKAKRLADLQSLPDSSVSRVLSAFDGAFYLQQYEDVARSGVDPFEHYMSVGWKEMRDPSAAFSTRYYLRRSPDIAATQINPFVHWVLQGIHEGRHVAASDAIDSPLEKAKKLTDLQGLPDDAVSSVLSAFDGAFYLQQYEDVARSDVDPFEHYMSVGWKEMRDPSAAFSTRYYLRRSPDIAATQINPFVHWVLHGIHEGRQSCRRRPERLEYFPKVSAIIPNYNHARFIRQRIESVLNQTYPKVEVLILDDCSTDDSRDIIEEYANKYPSRVHLLFNSKNSGNVFTQWQKGIAQTDGELIWVCESDDFCELTFLENLVPYFQDRSISIAFGRIQFVDCAGKFQEGADQYRQAAEPGIWNTPVVRPACEWFQRGFGVNNVIPNVGGCLWRRQSLPNEIWLEAMSYSVLGDWFLYLNLAGGGQIAFEPAAVAYFRQHGDNVSVLATQEKKYYEEHQRLMLALRDHWCVPEATVISFFDKVNGQYHYSHAWRTIGPLDDHLNVASVLMKERTRLHILVAFLGFQPGGGEVFPIHLANEIRKQGYCVSMLALDMEEVNYDLWNDLDTGIPVYDSAWVKEYGADRFLIGAGISIIHSHMIMLDSFFFEHCHIQTKIPYVVTLHGSYESSEITKERLDLFVDGVTHFVYTADKKSCSVRARTSRYGKIHKTRKWDAL